MAAGHGGKHPAEAGLGPYGPRDVHGGSPRQWAACGSCGLRVGAQPVSWLRACVHACAQPKAGSSDAGQCGRGLQAQ